MCGISFGKCSSDCSVNHASPMRIDRIRIPVGRIGQGLIDHTVEFLAGKDMVMPLKENGDAGFG